MQDCTSLRFFSSPKGGPWVFKMLLNIEMSLLLNLVNCRKVIAIGGFRVSTLWVPYCVTSLCTLDFSRGCVYGCLAFTHITDGELEVPKDNVPFWANLRFQVHHRCSKLPWARQTNTIHRASPICCPQASKAESKYLLCPIRVTVHHLDQLLWGRGERSGGPQDDSSWERIFFTSEF